MAVREYGDSSIAKCFNRSVNWSNSPIEVAAAVSAAVGAVVVVVIFCWELISMFTHSDDVDECRFARILQSDQRQFHLFLPEETFEPVQDPIDYRQHFSFLRSRVRLIELQSPPMTCSISLVRLYLFVSHLFVHFTSNVHVFNGNLCT